MPKIGKMPPSRISKKQIVAYVEPSLRESVVQLSRKKKKNIDEIIAESINFTAKQLEMEPIFPEGHLRLTHRNSGKAAEKTKITAGRQGKVLIGGWFDKNYVAEAKLLGKANNLSMQKLIEFSLQSYLSQEPMPLIFKNKVTQNYEK